MRRWLIAAAATVLIGGGTGAALAATQSSPGPNGNNTFGLCTAYGSGSSTGQNQKQANGAAFVALEAAAAAWDQMTDQNSTDPSEQAEAATGESQQQQVQEYCQANGQQP